MTDTKPRLGPPPKRPHLYSGNPRDPYCQRCHKAINGTGKECRGKDLLE
jgi:hypothetical protein